MVLSSSEEEEQPHDELASKVIEAFDRCVDTVDESVLVSWLMSRCQRRRDEATDDDKRQVYNDHVIALSASWMDMCDNNSVPRPRLRGMLRDFARLSPRSGSPTAALSCEEVVGELLQIQSNVNSLESEAAALGAHTDDAMQHKNDDAVMADPDGAAPMDVDQEAVHYGPLTEVDDALVDIHVRRERGLAEIRDQLRTAYDVGAHEEIWALIRRSRELVD